MAFPYFKDWPKTSPVKKKEVNFRGFVHIYKVRKVKMLSQHEPGHQDDRGCIYQIHAPTQKLKYQWEI